VGDTNPVDLVLSHDMSVTANFRDAIPPTVSVLFPNGGQVLIVGTPCLLRWDAADQEAVTFVDLDASRDGGATWDPIAAGVQNTGSYVWTPPSRAGDSGSQPVFQSLFRVTAHDGGGNTTTDQSDDFFAVFDLGSLAVD